MMKMFSKKVISVLEDKRKEQQLSINEVETKAGVGKNTLQSMISGKTKEPSLERIFKIANVLNLNIVDLMGKSLDIDDYDLQEKTQLIRIKQGDIEDIELFGKCANAAFHSLKFKKNKIRTKDLINVILEIYNYSYKDKSVDSKFVDWIINDSFDQFITKE